MGTVFRPARREEAFQLLGLVEQLGYPAARPDLERRLARLLGEPDQALLVAEDARTGALLGWVHVQESLSLVDDPIGLVTGLVVAADARGQGLGRGLMEAAEGWARARGLASMRLRARARRRAARAFYERLGYGMTKRQLQFRKSL